METNFEKFTKTNLWVIILIIISIIVEGNAEQRD